MAFAATVWEDGAVVIKIGGDWAYAVGETTNGNIRIAKGKLSGANPDSNAPISQGMKLNLKPKDAERWEKIKVAVDNLMYACEGEE